MNETGIVTSGAQKNIQTSKTTCLRCIFDIRWPDKIGHGELWQRTRQEAAANQILRRQWGWTRHTFWKSTTSNRS